MKFQLLAIFVCKLWKSVDADMVIDSVDSYCPLDCKNGAWCRRLKSDKLQHLIALGQTVDFCGPCPDGFVGIACDIPQGCLIAYRHSEFAGLMCQNPITEYCLPDGSQYCTNGGKCSKFFLHGTFPDDQLCACPLEFKGPHCEWLKLEPDLVDAAYVHSRTNKRVSDAMATSTFILLSLSIVIIVIVLFLQRRRKERLLSRDVDDFEEEKMWDEVSLRMASSREEEPYNFSTYSENDKENDSYVFS